MLARLPLLLAVVRGSELYDKDNSETSVAESKIA